jgi:CBS domain-containing protein
MNLREVMTSPVIACHADDTLATAARLMWDHDIGALPVIDAAGRLAGMVTDRDICMCGYTQGRPLEEIAVDTAMAHQVYECRVDESVESAEELMSATQVHRVPIVNARHEPVGIVSVTDLVRAAMTGGRHDSVGRKIVETLASIAAPRARPWTRASGCPETTAVTATAHACST